jgi:predicted glutamine amidotransferase
MCRLLGYCSRGSASVAEVLGRDELADFTRLSAYHRDGWGMAWYQGGRPHGEKSPLRAADDQRYHQLTERSLGDLGLVHLRRATPGLPIQATNSHPFCHGVVMMAHNGAIGPQARLGELLPPAWESQLTGSTDSERYFLYAMSRLQERDGDMVAALADTCEHIDRLFSASSLNALFLTPDALYAVCWYDPASIPAGAAAQLGSSGPPERYFDLAYLQTPSSVAVASSGWPQPGWTWLPNRHVLVVDRATLTATPCPLQSVSASTTS